MEVNQESRETAEHSLRREEQVASGQLSQTNAEPRRRKAVARPSSTFTVDDSQTVKESSWQPWTATRRFWQSEVSIVVDRKCSRDHLGA